MSYRITDEEHARIKAVRHISPEEYSEWSRASARRIEEPVYTPDHRVRAKVEARGDAMLGVIAVGLILLFLACVAVAAHLQEQARRPGIEQKGE